MEEGRGDGRARAQQTTNKLKLSPLLPRPPLPLLPVCIYLVSSTVLPHARPPPALLALPSPGEGSNFKSGGQGKERGEGEGGAAHHDDAGSEAQMPSTGYADARRKRLTTAAGVAAASDDHNRGDTRKPTRRCKLSTGVFWNCLAHTLDEFAVDSLVQLCANIRRPSTASVSVSLNVASV